MTRDVFDRSKIVPAVTAALVGMLVWNANGLLARVDRLEQNQQIIMVRLGVCPAGIVTQGPEKTGSEQGFWGDVGESRVSREGFLPGSADNKKRADGQDFR